MSKKQMQTKVATALRFIAKMMKKKGKKGFDKKTEKKKLKVGKKNNSNFISRYSNE